MFSPAQRHHRSITYRYAAAHLRPLWKASAKWWNFMSPKYYFPPILKLQNKLSIPWDTSRYPKNCGRYISIIHCSSSIVVFIFVSSQLFVCFSGILPFLNLHRIWYHWQLIWLSMFLTCCMRRPLKQWTCRSLLLTSQAVAGTHHQISTAPGVAATGQSGETCNLCFPPVTANDC